MPEPRTRIPAAETTVGGAVRLAAWGSAALAGMVGLDTVAQRVASDGPPHRVAGLPGDADPVALGYALGRLRALGVQRLRAVLPVPGDAAGLPGPPEFNREAIAAGAAVVAVSPPGGPTLGLLPVILPTHPGPAWACREVGTAGGSALPDLPTAERALTTALRDAAAALTDLDFAGADPGTAEAVAGWRRHSPAPDLPPGHPPRAVRVAAQAARLLDLLTIAARSHGTAYGAGDMAARAAALQPVARTARHALAAAASAYP